MSKLLRYLAANPLENILITVDDDLFRVMFDGVTAPALTHALAQLPIVIQLDDRIGEHFRRTRFDADAATGRLYDAGYSAVGIRTSQQRAATGHDFVNL